MRDSRAVRRALVHRARVAAGSRIVDGRMGDRRLHGSFLDDELRPGQVNAALRGFPPCRWTQVNVIASGRNGVNPFAPAMITQRESRRSTPSGDESRRLGASTAPDVASTHRRALAFVASPHVAASPSRLAGRAFVAPGDCSHAVRDSALGAAAATCLRAAFGEPDRPTSGELRKRAAHRSTISCDESGNKVRSRIVHPQITPFPDALDATPRARDGRRLPLARWAGIGDDVSRPARTRFRIRKPCAAGAMHDDMIAYRPRGTTAPRLRYRGGPDFRAMGLAGHRHDGTFISFTRRLVEAA